MYVPRAANVLREREHHIALLEGELATKNEWLRKTLEEHEDLVAKFRELKETLERANRWAQALNREIEQRDARILELQEEMEHEQESARRMAAAYDAKVREVEEDVRAKTKWALDVEAALQADVQKQTADLVAAVAALHHTEKELEERTAWAFRLQEEARALEQQLALVRASRWVKLGRKAGLGPALPPG